MAPLEASSGAAPVSRQRPLSTLLRAGAGRGRLRFHLLASSRQWAAVARGADPGDGRLGPSWGAAAPLGTSSGAATGSRWSPESILVEVDFGRFWPGAVGLLLPSVKPISGQVDEPRSRPNFASNFFAIFGPHLQASSFGPSRLVGPKSILVQVDFWLNVVWHSRPTAPSGRADYRPSR